MHRPRILCWLIILMLVISACSIDVSQVAVPNHTITAAPENNTTTPALPVSRIPVTWSDLHLSGKLVFMNGGEKVDVFTMTIQSLDLITGEISTIFKAADNAYIYSMAVSPDGKQVIMSYSPPLANGSLGTPMLYLLPIDGTAGPGKLFTPPSAGDEYFQPVWAPDAKTVYFSHIKPGAPPKGQQTQEPEIDRIILPEGTIEKVADSAFWPNISADSTQLVYVSIDPNDGTNRLVLANPDGSDPHTLVMSGKWVPNIIDAPIFLPGNETILFSSLSVTQAYVPSWLDQLLGVTVASAHSVPSDWWTISAAGGVATQLTHIQATSLYASISPDKKYIGSISDFGLFVMNPDGTGTRVLVNSLGGVPSTLNWIP